MAKIDQIHTRNTFATSATRWLMTSKAILIDAGQPATGAETALPPARRFAPRGALPAPLLAAAAQSVAASTIAPCMDSARPSPPSMRLWIAPVKSSMARSVSTWRRSTTSVSSVASNPSCASPATRDAEPGVRCCSSVALPLRLGQCLRGPGCVDGEHQRRKQRVKRPPEAHLIPVGFPKCGCCFGVQPAKQPDPNAGEEGRCDEQQRYRHPGHVFADHMDEDLASHVSFLSGLTRSSLT